MVVRGARFAIEMGKGDGVDVADAKVMGWSWDGDTPPTALVRSRYANHQTGAATR
jgi:hypothetical protein